MSWTGARFARVAYWATPSLLCLVLYWQGFTAWFRADDFAWLALAPGVHSWHDLVRALFAPAAQGTIRPLSERLLFLAGYSLFGMDPLPLRILIFATQFANLVLVAAIGKRIGGRPAAGFWAAVLWVVNGALVEPLGWVCVSNQVLCGLFLLSALHCMQRSVEAAKAGNTMLAKRYDIVQWLVFLVGFGVHELNFVVPALLAAYAWCRAPERLRSTLPKFAVSGLYLVLRVMLVPAPRTGDYAPHFTAGTLGALGQYWSWSVGPVFLNTPLGVPDWAVEAAIALVSVGLLLFAAWKARSGARAAVFCLSWFLIAIIPVLPFTDHLTGYYVYVPLIGICWLGGWALAESWDHGIAVKAAAVILVLLYGLLVMPPAVTRSRSNHLLTMRVRNLVEGIAGAHERHPTQTIVLDGVDTELFWNCVLDRPFRMLGIENVWLTPGSEGHIDAYPNLGDIHQFVLPADAAISGLAKGEMVVYDVTGERLRNVTTSYEVVVPASLSSITASDPLSAGWLGHEWYPLESDHRWMPRRASVLLAAPVDGGRKLLLEGNCSREQLRAGPLHVTAKIDGIAIGVEPIASADGSFHLEFPIPASMLGRPALRVEIEVDRTFRVPPDERDLGLAFGTIAIR